MSKISIIIPVYNGSEWLVESIGSVLGQTFEDFELICVDDFSVDDSAEIIKKFQEKDKRVKYYKKENEGPGAALNFGIKKAKGEFLCFLDQDDKYENTYLEKMLSTIEKTKCDVCVCNAYFWENDKTIKSFYPEIKSKNNIVKLNSAKNTKILSAYYFPQWAKIIKKDFLLENRIEFPNRENKAHDVPVHYKLISLCDKIGYVGETLYYHRVHDKQITYNFDIALYHLMAIEDILSWLDANKKAKKNAKNFLKYLIKYSAYSAKEEFIFEKLREIISKNYNFFTGYKIKNYVNRKYKKFRKEKEKIYNT